MEEHQNERYWRHILTCSLGWLPREWVGLWELGGQVRARLVRLWLLRVSTFFFSPDGSFEAGDGLCDLDMLRRHFVGTKGRGLRSDWGVGGSSSE